MPSTATSVQEVVGWLRDPLQLGRMYPRKLSDKRSETQEQDGEDAAKLGNLLRGAYTVRK